uniref:Putative glutathione S-transferase-like protein n=1 Tax=Helianthus annuus TaxID=4232 RepID=A0A251VKM3_HELAN
MKPAIKCKCVEVFVGGLARSVTEDKVHKVFSTCGEIMDIHLIKDQNGSLKGFGFVRFTTKDVGDKALKELNESMGKRLVFSHKLVTIHFFWGTLTKVWWSADDFSNVVCQVFPDVSIDLAQPSGSETISKKFKDRGFGFVKFSSHAVSCSTRSRALKVGAKPNFVLGGTLHPSVKWAEEDAGVDTQELAKIKIAFIINLPSTADENYLKLLFGPFGKVGCVQGWSHTVSVKTKPFCQFVQIYPIEQWIDCSSFEIDVHIRGWLYPRLRFGSYIKRAEESSIAGLKRGFDALNSYLASHTFLVGDGVTWVEEEEEAPKPKLKFLGGSFTCDAYYTATSTRLTIQDQKWRRDIFVLYGVKWLFSGDMSICEHCFFLSPMVVESSIDILAAAVKKLPSGKDDTSLIYAFYSVHETKKNSHARFDRLEWFEERLSEPSVRWEW